MSLYKRGSIWWIRFTKPDGGELRETTQTADRRAAQEYHDTRKAELWRVAKLGESVRHTWQEAVVRWLEEHPDQRGLINCVIAFRQADPILGGLYLDQITAESLATLTHQWRRAALKNSTINGRIAKVRIVLNAATRWGWLASAPHSSRLPEIRRRVRWLTRDEADRLIVELPDYLKPMVRFSLATGLREKNVAQLEWSQVNMDQRAAWIHADQAKSGKPLQIPLNADAVCVLREQFGIHPRWVFPLNGKPIRKPGSNAWHSAMQRAGVENFRWHDLRHTWASWHVQAGTPLPVLKELGGWASLDMVMRYAHLGATHLAEHAERISGPRLVRTISGTAPAKVAATG